MVEYKNRLSRMTYWTGANAISRILLRRRPRIVMMHNVKSDEAAAPSELSVSKLRDMLRAIRRQYTPLLCKDFFELWRDGGSVPENAVMITFDDGFRSFHDYVFPLLQEFEVPATVFVCPGLIDSGAYLWSDRVKALYIAGLRKKTEESLDSMLAALLKMSSRRRNRCHRGGASFGSR